MDCIHLMLLAELATPSPHQSCRHGGMGYYQFLSLTATTVASLSFPVLLGKPFYFSVPGSSTVISSFPFPTCSRLLLLCQDLYYKSSAFRHCVTPSIYSRGSPWSLGIPTHYCLASALELLSVLKSLDFEDPPSLSVQCPEKNPGPAQVPTNYQMNATGYTPEIECCLFCVFTEPGFYLEFQDRKRPSEL